jgi:hypothetical protein
MHSVTLIRTPRPCGYPPPPTHRILKFAIDSFGQNSVLQRFMLKLFLDSCYELWEYLRYHLEVQP